MLFGVCLSVLLIVYYVRPYQVATATLLAGARLDWGSAEALLALGWAALFVPSGLLAHRLIVRSYRP